MDFIITKEQQRMQKAAREFLKAKYPSDFVREMEQDEKGFTTKLWRKMNELDWMALTVPEAYDGVGGGLLDLVLLLEEMGRACVLGPFFSTVVLGAFSIAEYGSETQKQAFLPKIANGKIRLTLALTEPETTRYDPMTVSTTARPHGENYRINGTKLFVQNASTADTLICAACTADQVSDKNGITLFLVDAKSSGIRMTPLKAIGGEKLYEVIFTDVDVPGDRILGRLNGGEAQLKNILDYAAICKCAEMVGGAEKVLEMAADYARERRQFGKPIGSFQSIQHHCANMLILLEGSRYITYKAAWMLENEGGDSREVAIAKAWVSDAYKKITALGHQVQGGAAFMEEHDMQLFSRRSAEAAVTFGDSAYHRNRIACSLGL